MLRREALEQLTLLAIQRAELGASPGLPGGCHQPRQARDAARDRRLRDRAKW